MRRKSRFIVYGFVGLIFALSASVDTLAQNREQYGISAKAGGVNLVSGEVTVKRQGATGWQSLTSSDDLQNGDLVSTGANGRVEVLLSPGSYLRASENSAFELIDSSLDSLRLQLTKGSALVEASGADGARMFLEVDTPQTRIMIDRKGLYRINLLSQGATELLVRKGEARIGSDSSTAVKVKDGKKATVGIGSEVVTAMFEKEDQDAFDIWSERRAESLVAASRRLPDRALASSYTSYRRSGIWGMPGYRSISGLWIYDPYIGGRTFLPFYYGWSSPYGRRYSSGFGFPSHRHSFFSFGSGAGHDSRHRSDHFSRTPHSGRVHHQSPTHRSSPHHRRGH
ncbi:MAG TPA: FecR domain-containing protein [Pyrinomonadaceae bacterium]|nr:FecR domain-containing protein [Pyrinomonadaceae bacterium]